MNGRLFAKRFVAVVLLLFGIVSLAGDGETWMKAALLAVCIVLAVLLFRRTARDDEWMRRCRGGDLAGQAVARTVGEIAAEREAKPPDPNRKLKGALVGLTVLNVITFPFRVVWDVMRNQK